MEKKKDDPLAEALNAYLFESPAKSTFRAILARHGLAVVPVEPTLEIILCIAHPQRPEDWNAGKAMQDKLGTDVIPPRHEYEVAAGQWQRLIAAAQEPGHE